MTCHMDLSIFLMTSLFRMQTSFDLHHAVLDTIPWILTDPADITWFNQLSADSDLQSQLFNDDYWDLLVVSYDRFYRAISLCPESCRRDSAIRNTARRLYYGHIIGRIATLTAPPTAPARSVPPRRRL